MKTLLDDLWYNHPIGVRLEQSQEEKDALNELIVYEDELRNSLTQKQKMIYKRYETCSIEVNCISEKEAFIKGVRFATQYLFNALYTTEK